MSENASRDGPADCGHTSLRTASTFRNVITPAVLFRLALGWGAFVAVLTAEPVLSAHLPSPLLVGVLVGITAVIIVCAFGVVAEAEHLAHRLGDPYGTLVLTLSIVLIEVVLISAVMLGPGEHLTIARDSVMAVLIILNLVIGIALLVGGMRHGALEPNRTGVSSYLSLLVVLTTLAFVLPGLIGSDGAYGRGQEIPIIALTVLLYAFFLHLQMGRQRADFQEVSPRHSVTGTSDAVEVRRPPIAEVLSQHRKEVGLRAVTLVMTVLPIVLLSHDMAALLDDGLDRAGAPVALSGILIAMIVFLPETITAVRAAHAGEIQRVSNLCHGALVSTVGLTIPAVLTIGLLTGQTVVLAEDPTNLALLGVTLLLSVTTFAGKKVTPLHGAAHLLVFLIYGLTVFS
ncbi:calcium:proton antiporter [Saccharopolyspora sp. WRP15-2]|uniref:Calcium:proton antiporter n=1 Tax=Saccharopolyspora oryzae TaxID=2997343 RepID=A0ABT4V2N3_9PSEU|nr:calcium:proton antiporter [Saccharopolyspora oryzae]MDA3628227.1 calcium:proton antiporter [Saccharopolyspora oryzae]